MYCLRVSEINIFLCPFDCVFMYYLFYCVVLFFLSSCSWIISELFPRENSGVSITQLSDLDNIIIGILFSTILAFHLPPKEGTQYNKGDSRREFESTGFSHVK